MAEWRRLKLIVSYDGRHFAGWQSQKHGNTIQQQIEAVFAKITGERLPVVGAGRTDAGVHALGQCAHVDVPGDKMSTERWCKALNAILPTTIRVMRCAFVSQKFHARFSAKAKIYRYRIINSAVLSPFELERAWHVPAKLDRILLRKTAKTFLGRHDFRSFVANRRKPEADTIRTIHSVHVRWDGDLIEVELCADGFLYKMVRLIIGAIIRSATGQELETAIQSRLKDASCAGPRLAAPSSGLYLVRVQY